MLYDALPQIAVTIGYEDRDGNVNEVRSLDKDAYLSLSLASALSKLGLPRIDQLIADIIESLGELGEFEYSRDYFPGQQDAINDLFAAAQKIQLGWEEHDRKLGI